MMSNASGLKDKMKGSVMSIFTEEVPDPIDLVDKDAVAHSADKVSSGKLDDLKSKVGDAIKKKVEE